MRAKAIAMKCAWLSNWTEVSITDTKSKYVMRTAGRKLKDLSSRFLGLKISRLWKMWKRCWRM